jgi:hypothetical protein
LSIRVVLITLDWDVLQGCWYAERVSFCCLPSFFFILVMSSRTKRIITERRPLSCSTSTGMTALTTHFYSAPASSSLSDFDRGCVRMPTLAGWRRRWLRILRPKITPASPATATKSTTRPFTTHDWPVRSHYYYRLLRKCARVVIVGVCSPIRNHAELSGLCR